MKPGLKRNDIGRIGEIPAELGVHKPGVAGEQRNSVLADFVPEIRPSPGKRSIYLLRYKRSGCGDMYRDQGITGRNERYPVTSRQSDFRPDDAAPFGGPT